MFRSDKLRRDHDGTIEILGHPSSSEPWVKLASLLWCAVRKIDDCLALECVGALDGFEKLVDGGIVEEADDDNVVLPQSFCYIRLLSRSCSHHRLDQRMVGGAVPSCDRDAGFEEGMSKRSSHIADTKKSK